ncbi:MAG: eCIS core domain-containing protein [Ginsengibacter sp.]
MKAAQLTTAATPAKKNNPFFNKESEQDFFHSSINEQPFFSKNKTNSSFPIQTKLTIGAPNDRYEKEADATADKVVQRLSQSGIQTKPFSSDTMNVPFLQKKCAHCEEEPIKQQIRKKPVFESNSERLDDDKSIQRKCAECEKEEKLQKKEDQEGPVKEQIQKKPIFESDAESLGDYKNIQRKCAECEKEEKLQKKSESTSLTTTQNIESRLSSSKGSGSPLPHDTRAQMESSFDADFSNVRIHNDSSAVQMSKDLNAHAFTHGSDVYFNSGKYDAYSNSGKRLLAHELTHTIQQGQHANSVQRNATDAASGALSPAPPYKVKGIEFNPTAKTLVIPNINLPDFKRRNSSKYQLPIHALEGRPTTRQVLNWNEGVKSSVNAKVAVFLSSIQKPAGDRYFLKSKNTEYRLFGTKENIQAYTYIPEWNRKGMKNYHEVDHIVEMQLGGQDVIDNYELTDATANNSSGIEIQKERYNKVAAALTELTQANIPDLPKNDKVASRELVVMFNKVANWNLPYSGDGKMYWTRNEIEEGVHLKQLRGMTAKEIAKSQGTADELVLYVNERSGSPLRLPVPFTNVVTNWIPGIDVTACPPPDQNAMDNKKFGTLNIQLNKNFSGSLKSNASFPVSYNKTPGLLNTGYLTFTQDQRGIADLLRFEGLSPVVIEEFRLDERLGIILHGKIHTNIPLIKDSDIDLSVEGKDVMISKTFSSGEIKGLPNPLKVTDVSLMLFASTKFGFGVQGNVEFEIEKLGKGNVKGLGATREGFGVSGEFIFDSKKFEGSKIGFEYKNQKWAINGTIQVAKGSIKGVKSGSLTIKYESEKITANGEAILSVPGIEKVTLDAEFEKNGDFIINGGVDLKKLPGIKAGHVDVSIASRKEENDVKLKVAGKASPDFPNVPSLNTELSVLYDDGLFEIRTKVQYQKGKFDGTIDVGVTNKSVDEKGQPQGEPNEGKELIVFGFGSLTVTLFKNITGTVTVRLTPEKEVLVGGDIEIKDLKPFGEGYHPPDKELLKFPRITIPLVGLPGLSISAFIDGGVYFKFSWDPLVLKELKVGFQEININEIENATLDIHGEVGSIADAEVYLTIKAGLEGRALIATLSGSIGGEAGLGVSAEAGGELDASWNKDKGLQFKEIRAYLNVTPRAVFRLTGDVSVDLDLWITTVNLYYHKWVFDEKQLDLGGLTLKADFPIKFDEENNLILPSLDQINLQKPDFTGSQGKDILDKAINGDSEQELEQKKQQIKAEIENSLRKKYNEKDFSFSDYKDSMVEKYGKSPELKEFVLKTIEDESNRLEHERFEEEKSKIRSMPVPLANKISLVNIITMFNRYITEADRQTFIIELTNIEIEKQKAQQVKKDAVVNGTGNVANSPTNSTEPSQVALPAAKKIQAKTILENNEESEKRLSSSEKDRVALRQAL